MEVTVDEQKGRIKAEPLFEFMKMFLINKKKTVDEWGKDFREKVLRQLRLLLIHAKLDSSKAVTIEANMYSKHKNNLMDYYNVTKLSPTAIIQTYAKLDPTHMPTPVLPKPPALMATPLSNAQAAKALLTVSTMTVNGQLRTVAIVNLAKDKQPNPRVPGAPQVRLPAPQQASPQVLVVKQIQQQAKTDQVVKQSQQQQIPIQPNISNQAPVTHSVVQVSRPQAEQGNVEGLVPPVPHKQTVPLGAGSSDTQCPFCAMRFDMRSGLFYQHLAVVHIPRLINDTPQAKVRCTINNCGFEYSDRLEQLQGSMYISGKLRLIIMRSANHWHSKSCVNCINGI